MNTRRLADRLTPTMRDVPLLHVWRGRQIFPSAWKWDEVFSQNFDIYQSEANHLQTLNRRWIWEDAWPHTLRARFKSGRKATCFHTFFTHSWTLELTSNEGPKKKTPMNPNMYSRHKFATSQPQNVLYYPVLIIYRSHSNLSNICEVSSLTLRLPD